MKKYKCEWCKAKVYFSAAENIFKALKQDLISLILMGKLGISHQNSDKGLQL